MADPTRKIGWGALRQIEMRNLPLPERAEAYENLSVFEAAERFRLVRSLREEFLADVLDNAENPLVAKTPQQEKVLALVRYLRGVMKFKVLSWDWSRAGEKLSEDDDTLPSFEHSTSGDVDDFLSGVVDTGDADSYSHEQVIEGFEIEDVYEIIKDLFPVADEEE